jgi:hypothetical protein
MLVDGEYNALAEPVLHHHHRPVNQSDECDLGATLRLARLLPVGGARAMPIAIHRSYGRNGWKVDAPEKANMRDFGRSN